MSLAGRRVVLGVSGGIACYKSCILARRLTECGAAVDVILTAAATEFVRPLTFEALTRRPVHTSLWDRDRALAHIDLARTPDVIVVAPATANLLSRAAQGLADDLLTAVLLATRAPVLVAPSMNDEMYANAATQRSLAMVRERGWAVVGPAIGALAEGPSERPGRMAEPEDILAEVERLIVGADSRLSGRRVLVTAGPTREPLDAVRVLTNPSSGKMGYSLAARAFARGAEVILIAGPTTLPPPYGPEVVRITTTAELLQAVEQRLPDADVLIMAAAPADFAPRVVADGKPSRSDGGFNLDLVPTPDVLELTTARRKPGAVTVGFALETGTATERARSKRDRKGLDLIVLNRADELGSGFEVDTNRVTLIGEHGETPLELLPKPEVADRILDAVERLL
ncbi:MAG: bifunctional phosphopantothenoylcysteine decarboxylase/phosphopantothenate--cysteine ligase CoaBC [Gemmatimonadota bacterium]|nr:bifunctional phosphopantothenoylcysteine decarboxylase/phosphopantothenate--cysteine ligase CoaBC [Gemmatimonadota bacterium]MDH3368633.1 bifunctional phosphopantothenoylcysteine decarboxylase/phosphopantothenate--cysteine ligase CoaBC [Gemmatimonadota bacterium]MDH3479903.1 bifunctional phosphopantothenoylcysteine decarboxylase/phosphopantothenate--cysteine ligase CoaBC [Gemmatimonadota bacterium]MDH3570876.1 bifunctional phosphopantothenoylcysteine decarboxylase/phosphopantothenate--cystein